MSGATGAGASGNAADGVRGPATGAQGQHRARDSQGGTVTDTRGPQAQQYGGPEPYAAPTVPGEGQHTQGGQHAQPGRHSTQTSGGAQPYQPPQAYSAPTTGGQQPGAVRRARTGARTVPRTRKARLRVAKSDPWSVMKVSFLLSIALGVCTIIAAAVLWMVMDAMGVFSTVGGTISEATGSGDGSGFDLETFLSLPRVLMFTSIIAVIDVVLMTALATLGAFIYNLSAGFVGGVELTLAEDE
ncbi:DUF3566 domain-containing protein [Streptomyces sp. NPDC007088]|uniref:DUF3566 domain-containing protein n=1 Tax=Streptomyces sp. NPDC007088 TaxID=3364773 RepID=UPI0036CF289E